jgi:WD40 repeat protein
MLIPGKKSSPSQGTQMLSRALPSAPTADGSSVVVGRDAESVGFEAGQEILTLSGHFPTVSQTAVMSVAFSPDGKRSVSGGSDQTLKIWDAETGHETLTLRGHAMGVLSVAFSPDGTRIVSGSDDRTLKVWDARTGQSITRKAPRPSGAADSGLTAFGSQAKLRVEKTSANCPVASRLE